MKVNIAGLYVELSLVALLHTKQFFMSMMLYPTKTNWPIKQMDNNVFIFEFTLKHVTQISLLQLYSHHNTFQTWY